MKETIRTVQKLKTEIETIKGRDGERGKRMRKGWQREGETE